MKMLESYHFFITLRVHDCGNEESQFFEKTVVKLVSSDFHLIFSYFSL
jgi:hypothetical protein